MLGGIYPVPGRMGPKRMRLERSRAVEGVHAGTTGHHGMPRRFHRKQQLRRMLTLQGQKVSSQTTSLSVRHFLDFKHERLGNQGCWSFS